VNRTTFNEGWAFRPKTNRFAEMSGRGAEWTPVTLPHDALIGAERSPSGSPATGYFPGGVWEYRKTLDVASGDARSVVVLEFEGVYREAVVSVNGTIAAHRPYGYSNFFVEIGHLLRTGVRNDIAVEAQAHEDSRWYSGAGIYRNVWLLRSGSVHFTPDLLEVRTPEIGDDGAVVTIAAAIRNTSDSTAIVTLRAEVVEADGTVVARQEAPVTLFPGESVTARQRLYVDDPHRWGPDDPYLYTCRISLHGPDGGDVIDLTVEEYAG